MIFRVGNGYILKYALLTGFLRKSGRGLSISVFEKKTCPQVLQVGKITRVLQTDLLRLGIS